MFVLNFFKLFGFLHVIFGFSIEIDLYSNNTDIKENKKNCYGFRKQFLPQSYINNKESYFLKKENDFEEQFKSNIRRKHKCIFTNITDEEYLFLKKVKFFKLFLRMEKPFFTEISQKEEEYIKKNINFSLEEQKLENDLAELHLNFKKTLQIINDNFNFVPRKPLKKIKTLEKKYYNTIKNLIKILLKILEKKEKICYSYFKNKSMPYIFSDEVMVKEFEKIVRHKFKKVCKRFISLTQLIASLHKKLIIFFEKMTPFLNFISRIYDLNDLNPAIKKVIAKYKFCNREIKNSFLSILNTIKYSLINGFEFNKNLFLTEIKKHDIQNNTLKLFHDCEENINSIIIAIEQFEETFS